MKSNITVNDEKNIYKYSKTNFLLLVGLFWDRIVFPRSLKYYYLIDISHSDKTAHLFIFVFKNTLFLPF